VALALIIVAELAFAPPAVAHLLLQHLFFLGARNAFEPSSHLRVGFRLTGLAPLADPAEELGGVEGAVAAVDERRRHAVLEFQIADVATLAAARGVPDAGRRAHALHHAAADKPHDVDVVRPLIQHDAMAHRELVLPARAVHELVVVPRVDHAQLAELAAGHDLANFPDRRVEAVRMAAEELDA